MPDVVQLEAVSGEFYVGVTDEALGCMVRASSLLLSWETGGPVVGGWFLFRVWFLMMMFSWFSLGHRVGGNVGMTQAVFYHELQMPKGEELGFIERGGLV